MSRHDIDILHLQPGKRYRYTAKSENDAIVEGTFDKFIESPDNPYYNSYQFSNIVKYVRDSKNNLKKVKIGDSVYSGQYFRPRDIHFYEFEQLPEELNDLIKSYGGKSRKNRKSRKNNKSMKSNRRNRKSKK